MRAAAATVGHGGAGSVLSALAAGVPMTLVPMFADQPFNARLVAELGAGLMLDDGPASMPALEPAVRELLDDSRFRDRAQRIADEMRALPPVDDAVDALSALVALLNPLKGRRETPNCSHRHDTPPSRLRPIPSRLRDSTGARRRGRTYA